MWPKQSAASAEPGAFVVLGQKGFQRKFDTLAEAVAASNPGDTIEIRGDGPFVTDPIEIGHPLAIRAGEGFRPVVKNAPWIEGDERHLLSTDSPVVLEGLEVINTRDEPGFENWGASLHCTGPSAQLANCRFVKLWTGPIEANANSSVMLRTSSAVLRNCDFSQRRGYCLAWWFEPRAKLTLDNCVFPRVIGLLPASRVGGAQIRITRSTFSDRNNIGVHATDAASRQSFDAPSLLEFDVTETIFDQWNAMMVVVGLDSAEAETTVSNCIAWSDTRNIFSAANSMLICGPPWNPPANNFLKYDKALTAWKRYWNEPDAQVLSGRIRFTVADLMSKRSDAPQSITPEDFRLRPDSAGYRAGPGGRDLGADIDLVGPGAAYERWKKTPEYQGWLEETRRQMAESQTAEVHHRNSHEPSRVGPAVAPRPSTDH